MSGIVAGDGDQIDVRHAEKGVARRKAALHVNRSAPLTEPNVRGHSVHYAVVCQRPHRSQGGVRRPQHEVRNSRCESHSQTGAQVVGASFASEVLTKGGVPAKQFKSVKVVARLKLERAVKHESAGRTQNNSRFSSSPN